MERPNGRSLSFVAGLGIDGDRNQHPLSPRQVLVTRLEDLDRFGIQCGDLRENVVVTGILADEFVPGSQLRLGCDVRLRLTFLCEPCKRISHLGVPLHDFIGQRGILATVVSGGSVREGDGVVADRDAFLPLPDFPYQRFVRLLGLIPRGRVISYREATIGTGVAESYMRAIPGYIRKANPMLPLHRIVDTDGNLIPYVAGQAEKLEAEGIYVEKLPDLFSESGMNGYDLPSSKVSLERYLWKAEGVHLL